MKKLVTIGLVLVVVVFAKADESFVIPGEVVGVGYGHCSDLKAMKTAARDHAHNQCKAPVKQISEWDISCLDHISGEKSQVSARFKCFWW